MAGKRKTSAKTLDRWDDPPRNSSPPDFDNLLAVLQRRAPKRPTLFEFFLNGRLYERLAGGDVPGGLSERLLGPVRALRAYYHAGYDYVTVGVPRFGFPSGQAARLATRSINDGAVVVDRASFDAYAWPEAAAADYAILDDLAAYLPKGMKLVVYGPGGVEENVISLVGYERLCLLMADDPVLVEDIFAAVGSRLVRYYELAAKPATVGACIANDDWGFKTQPLLSPRDMDRYLFPWHQRIVEAIHAAGKPAILHSCGNQGTVLEAMITRLKYDGRHSYEDAIQPVENAYEQCVGRIAVLGGIDVDFITRSTPAEIYARSGAMLDRAAVTRWVPATACRNTSRTSTTSP